MSTKIILITLTLTSLLIPSAAFAEITPQHPHTLGWRLYLGGMLGLPIDSESSNTYNVGLAGTAAGGIQLSPQLTLLLSAEYLRHNLEDDLLPDGHRTDILLGLIARHELEWPHQSSPRADSIAQKTRYIILAGAGYDRISISQAHLGTDSNFETLTLTDDAPWLTLGLGLDRDFRAPHTRDGSFIDRLGLFIDGRLNLIFGSRSMTAVTLTAGLRLW